MGKIIFFDIDGTLIGYDGKMPDSTLEALRRAKENGNRIALCTGRSKTQIYPWLLELGFDGIVAAAGAYVECGGDIIFHQCMEKKAIHKAVEYFKQTNVVYGFQSQNGVMVYEDQAQRVYQVYEDMGLDKARLERLLAGQIIVEGEGFFDKVEKLFYYRSTNPVSTVQKALFPDMEVTISSFEEPDESSGEVSGIGINKALGMQRFIEHYGIDRKDTIAFGDGPNDVEMMQYAKIGIAMGNSIEFLKNYAYMVTDDIKEDGILHALQKLGIV